MCRSTLAQWNYREKFNNSSENVRFPNTIMYSSNMCTLLSNVISFLSTANFDCPKRLNHFQEERFRKLEEKCTVTVVKCEIFSLWCLWGGPAQICLISRITVLDTQFRIIYLHIRPWFETPALLFIAVKWQQTGVVVKPRDDFRWQSVTSGYLVNDFYKFFFSLFYVFQVGGSTWIWNNICKLSTYQPRPYDQGVSLIMQFSKFCDVSAIYNRCHQIISTHPVSTEHFDFYWLALQHIGYLYIGLAGIS